MSVATANKNRIAYLHVWNRIFAALWANIRLGDESARRILRTALWLDFY